MMNQPGFNNKNCALIEVLSNRENQIRVGNDIVFLPDFHKTLNPLFINKVYTDKEIQYCESFNDASLHYASTWSAKESVYKAIKQMYPFPIGFKKIEIFREKLGGVPRVYLGNHPASKHLISLSISHDGDYVWTIAIMNIGENLEKNNDY